MAIMSVEESLERAFHHVSEGWLPPQEEVLERIQERLQRGDYQNNREELIGDLKGDISLYLYCLKELSTMLELEDPAAGRRSADSSSKTPADIIGGADLSRLEIILNRERHEISQHSFAEISHLQQLRLRESLLSATTAEVLAETVKVEPETAFSCALLRQLGLTLIAWNYPRVYARALESLNGDSSLDALLKKALGFSPALLGITFARRWRLKDDFVAALGEKKKTIVQKNAFSSDKARDTAASDGFGAALAKICEVGEALARANDPEHYPNALSDWEAAQETIAAQLGPRGVDMIYERSQQYLRDYAKSSPAMATFVEASEAKTKISGTHYSAQLLEHNTYLRYVPETLKQKIKAFYLRFKENKILKTNVRDFMDELAPVAGFERGCVYLYDPERKVLAPAVKFGEFTAEQLRPVKISSVLAHFDLVASAFSLKSALREETADDLGRTKTICVGALGQQTRVGVLYLETKPDFTHEIGPDPMPIYRALRQTLSDCLNLT